MAAVGRWLSFALCLLVLLQPTWARGRRARGARRARRSGRSSRRRANPACAPNCERCIRKGDCDACIEGFTLSPPAPAGDTTPRSCQSCAANCAKCDTAGPDRCDRCLPRFAVAEGLCEPCPEGCSDCEKVGAKKCDACDDGYMLDKESSTCLQCTLGCQNCHDPTPSGCDTCFWKYTLQPDGSCTFSTVLIALMTSIVGICAFSVAWCVRSCRTRPSDRNHRLLDNEEYVMGGTSVAAFDDRPLPDGMWRGYFGQPGCRYGVCRFSLSFADDGAVTGDGTDSHGEYTIHGHSNSMRIAFTKRYKAGNTNGDGKSISSDQLQVVYQSQRAGDTLGGGFRGSWFLSSLERSCQGEFHMWSIAKSKSDDETASEGDVAGQLFEEAVCAMCYRRPVSTCLQPCGHVALCGSCAASLSPKRCPLCLASVTRVVNHEASVECSGRTHKD